MLAWLKRIKGEERSVARAASTLPRQQSLLAREVKVARQERLQIVRQRAGERRQRAGGNARAREQVRVVYEKTHRRETVRSVPHAPISKRRHLASEVHDDMLQSCRDALQPA